MAHFAIIVLHSQLVRAIPLSSSSVLIISSSCANDTVSYNSYARLMFKSLLQTSPDQNWADFAKDISKRSSLLIVTPRVVYKSVSRYNLFYRDSFASRHVDVGIRHGMQAHRLNTVPRARNTNIPQIPHTSASLPILLVSD